jgi:hypothetical protein
MRKHALVLSERRESAFMVTDDGGGRVVKAVEIVSNSGQKSNPFEVQEKIASHGIACACARSLPQLGQ